MSTAQTTILATSGGFAEELRLKHTNTVFDISCFQGLELLVYRMMQWDNASSCLQIPPTAHAAVLTGD